MSIADDLRRAVEDATPRLHALSEDAVRQRPAPGKWSKKEILGHLIDSAANNHQRFVRAQFQDDLVFPGYAQDEWVRVQRYQETEWKALIELWRRYNLHLARVIAAIPDAVRLREHRTHNLHRIAMRRVPEHEATTLDYFMRDYVYHLQHHLRQIVDTP